MLPELKIDYHYVRTLLTNFIRNEVTRVGMQRAVIGLSGGVDSALVAFLCAEALSPANVLCVMLPYRTSNPESLIHAEEVIRRLRVRSERIDITDMVEPLFASSPDIDRVRKGNIMARERMIVLYDRSQRDNALVIGTGNKTELLLGYSTLHGDAACAINPIGDLYKSQVWKLADHVGVPKAIIEKAPSADLWEGQTDEEELGLSYKRVDELLVFMVDERRSTEELLALGFEERLIARVQHLIRRNQFKRRPPIIAKVGSRTINADFRYPRDWGV